MGRSFLSIKLAVIFGLVVGAAVLVLEQRVQRAGRAVPVVEVTVRAASATAPAPVQPRL